MFKKILILQIILILISGCKNKQQVSCLYGNDDKLVSLSIEAINDDIKSINVRTSFKIPYNVMLNQEKFSFLLSQLDDMSHFEDNNLISEYDVTLDNKYSIDLTLKDLKTKRFNCE